MGFNISNCKLQQLNGLAYKLTSYPKKSIVDGYTLRDLIQNLTHREGHFATELACQTHLIPVLHKIGSKIKKANPVSYEKTRIIISRILNNSTLILNACNTVGLPVQEYQRFIKEFDGNVYQVDGAPIFKAIKENNITILRLFKELSVNFNIVNAEGNSPFFEAIYQNKPEVLKFLLTFGADINHENSHGWTPLHFAISRNFPEIVVVLAEKGANLNLEDSQGRPPLNYAISKNRLEILQILAANGAHLNMEDSQGWTPLKYAISLNNEEILGTLVDLGANINFEDSGGSTPLKFAMSEMRLPMIEKLASKGADLNFEDSKKKTPLKYAIDANYPEGIRRIVELGADVHLLDSRLMTPLVYAIKNRKDQCVISLIQCGADARQEDAHGTTPLSYALALSKNNEKVVTALLDNGADIEYVNTSEDTPLMLAYYYSPHLVKKLVKLGADQKFAVGYLNKALLAQIWGLEGKSFIATKKGRKKEVDLEGLNPKYAVTQFSEYLKKYFEKVKSKYFPLKKKMMDKILNAFNNAYPHEIVINELLSSIKKGEPAVMLGGSRGHAIALVIFDNKLCVCNRGVGRKIDAVEIYTLAANEVTFKMLKKFQEQYENANDFNKMINDLNLPQLAGLNYKSQKVGNCTWASLKAAFGVLCHLYVNDKEIYKDFVSDLREMGLCDYIRKSGCDGNDDCLSKIRKKIEGKSFKELLKVRKVLSFSKRIDLLNCIKEVQSY